MDLDLEEATVDRGHCKSLGDSILDLSRGPPDETREEHGSLVNVCGVECTVPDHKGIFYCNRVATEKGRCGYPTCRYHALRWSRKAFIRTRNPSMFPDLPKEEVYKRSIVIAGLKYETTRKELWSHFKECGGISWIGIVPDRWNGKPKGTAYLTFVSKESVTKAQLLSGSILLGWTIKISQKRVNIDDRFYFTQPESTERVYNEDSFSE